VNKDSRLLLSGKCPGRGEYEHVIAREKRTGENICEVECALTSGVIGLLTGLLAR
jgi:hypothetical protein